MMKLMLIFTLLSNASIVLARDIVSIIASDSIPPYVMGNEPSAKELPGLQVEIVDRAFALVGLKTIWQTMPNKRLMLQYEKGSIDAALNLSDVSSIKTYESDDLVFYRNCVIGSASLKNSWKQKFSSLRVLGFQNAKHVFAKSIGVEKFNNNKKYNEVPSQKTIAYHAVNSRADLVLSDALVFAYYAHTYFGPQYMHSDLACLFEQKVARHLGFKSKELRDLFNQGLLLLKKNGDYDALLEKYRKRFSMITRLESSFRSTQIPLAITTP